MTFTVDAYPEDVFTGKIFQVRKNSTTTQNVVTYPVVIEAPNPGMKLMPGMTANISFQIDVRENVTRIPGRGAAVRSARQLARTPGRQGAHRPQGYKEDPKEARRSSPPNAGPSRPRRGPSACVWVQDGDMLRAIPITIGLRTGSTPNWSPAM